MQFAYVPVLQLAGLLPRNKRNPPELYARHPFPCPGRPTENSPAIHCALSLGLRLLRPSAGPVGTAENSPAIHCWVGSSEPFSRPVGTPEPQSTRLLSLPHFRFARNAISHFFDRTTYATCFSRNSLQTKDRSKIRSQINSTLKTPQKRRLQNIIASSGSLHLRIIRTLGCAGTSGTAGGRW
jgi:hypothetical protein